VLLRRIYRLNDIQAEITTGSYGDSFVKQTTSAYELPEFCNI